jgi:putative transposase
LLGVHKSGLYYQPKKESELNFELMKLIDKEYTKHPFRGVPTMTDWLRLDKCYLVNKKRIERLYRLMDLRAIVPGPHTSKPSPEHKKYPYLLRNLEIERVNQVWATDITYIPVEKGFFYLIAVIDLKSRFVLDWSVSNTMEAEWCQSVVQSCVEKYGSPEIFNTDQGSQFTSEVFTSYLLQEGIKISMDGKGRAIDNIFIERLWRSVKYEKIYINSYATGSQLYLGLVEYFQFYNHERRHSSLDKHRPFDIFNGTESVGSSKAKVNPNFGNCKDQVNDLPQAQHKSVLTESKIGLNQAPEDQPKEKEILN